MYLRISRKDGDKAESDSIGNQRALLDTYAQKHADEFKIYDRYIDDDYTGTNFDRPAFQRMMEDIKTKKVSCIIVKDLSRFGRDYIDVGNYLQKIFPKLGVRFIAINDNIDSGKKAYDMLMPVKNIFNEQYARDISNKVLTALNTKQESGQFIGAFASYGYFKDPNNKNKLIIDPYASEVVKRIFNMFIEGQGKMTIAKELNNEKILCPSEYKKSINLKYHNCHKLGSTNYWTYSSIHVILNNEIYAGNMVQHKSNFSRYRNSESRLVDKDEWIVVHNTHEPIIEKDIWDITQTLLNKRTRELSLNQNISVYAGFLKCGDCGRSMTKITTRNRDRFVCGTYKRYSTELCSSHRIFKDELDELVLKSINYNINKVKKLVKIIQEEEEKTINKTNIDKPKQYLNKLEMQLSKVVSLKKGLYEDYKNGILTKEEYAEYKKAYTEQEASISAQIETIIESEPKTTEEIINNPWVIKFKEQPEVKEITREILGIFIDEIIIYENNEIDIKYKFNIEEIMPS